MKIHNFKAVFPFEGYVIEEVTCTGVGCQIDLRWDARRRLACPCCGSTMARNRETWHIAYDLPCGTHSAPFESMGLHLMDSRTTLIQSAAVAGR